MKSKKYKLIIFDIDGVFTDGFLSIDEDGKESKRICFRDIDAFFRLKKNKIKTAFITGEDTKITQWFNKRFEPDYFFSGCKAKDKAILEILSNEMLKKEELVYIGDSRHDLNAFNVVGLKVCPSNAVNELKAKSNLILKSFGGNGAVEELVEYLLDFDYEF